ncbi:hypothetical protein NL438_26575, partial [Klebsiella pneumoniae]|nr:hypothetical protein [Klebsiella pneumoniae]
PNATDRSDSPTLPPYEEGKPETDQPEVRRPDVAEETDVEEEESTKETAPATIDPHSITTTEKTLDDEIAVTRRGLHFFFNS